MPLWARAEMCQRRARCRAYPPGLDDEEQRSEKTDHENAAEPQMDRHFLGLVISQSLPIPMDIKANGHRTRSDGLEAAVFGPVGTWRREARRGRA